MADDVFAGLDPIVQKTAAPVPAADPEPAPFAGLEPITARQEGEWRGQRPEDSDVTWGDWGRGLAAGTVNIASGMAALTEFMTGGNLGHDRRKELEQTSQGIMAGASPEFRRATEASWTGGEGPGVLDVGIGRSLAAQLVQTLPSLVTTVIPAGMAGTLARGLGASIRTGAMVGAGVARAAEGAQDAGATAQQIMNSVEAIPDKELQAQSPQYRGYRAEMDEATARRHYNRDVMGVLPLVAGAISTALGGQGIEAGVARFMAGKDTKQGLVRGVLKGFTGEGIQEAGQNAGQEVSAQAALSQAGLSDASWQKIIEQAVQGFVVGGAMGVPGGAAIGAGERIRRKIQANKDSAAEAGVTGTGHGSDRNGAKDTQEPAQGSTVETTASPVGAAEATALAAHGPVNAAVSPVEEATQQSPPGPAPQTPTTVPSGMDATGAQAAPGAVSTEATNAAPAVAPEAQASAPEAAQAPVAPPQAAPAAAAPAGPVAAPAADAVGQAEIAKVNTAPTEAQKQAGNYAKGHVKFGGLDITIENPTGSERTGVGPDGKPWSTTMPAHYGYIKRTEGADGDHVDVYLADKPIPGHVYVVDQVDPATGKFDEHKVILGVPSKAKAQALYESGFSDGSGPKRMGAITYMKPGDFKEWLKTGDQTKPLGKAKADPKERLAALKEKKKAAKEAAKNEKAGVRKIEVTPALQAQYAAPAAPAETAKVTPEGKRVLMSLTAQDHVVDINKNIAQMEEAEKPAVEKAPSTELQTKDDTRAEQRAKDNETAKKLFDILPPTEAEKGGKLDAKAAKALRNRLKVWLEAAAREGVKVPGKWKDTHGNELGFLALVKALHNKFENNQSLPVKQMQEFVSDEYAARMGEWKALIKKRRTEGAANVAPQVKGDIKDTAANPLLDEKEGADVGRKMETSADLKGYEHDVREESVEPEPDEVAAKLTKGEELRQKILEKQRQLGAAKEEDVAAHAPKAASGFVKESGLKGLAPKVTGKISLGPKGAAAVRASFEAWHGSRHGFDKFDNTKIGIGEGAQVIAYGHYIAGAKGTAESYKLAGTRHGAQYIIRGMETPVPNSYDEALWPETVAARSLYLFKTETAAIGELQRKKLQAIAWNEQIKDVPAEVQKAVSPPVTEKTLARYDEAIRILENGEYEVNHGNLYRVFAKPDEHELLDWETPLYEQPVGQKILSAMGDFRDELQDYLDLHGQPELEDLTGRELHRLLERYASEDSLPGVEDRDGHHKREASEYISSLGVPGVKFLDQGSRAAAQGAERTYNYVIFNDADLEVLDRNGKPVTGDVKRAALADRAERDPLFNKLKRLVGIKEFHAGDNLKASDVASYVMRRAGAASALTGNPLHQAILPALAERLAKLLGDMDVIIVTPQAMRNLGVGDANGIYHSGEHAVYLTDEVINNAIMGPRVVVHELVHAAFMNATWSNPRIRRDVENLMKVVWDAYPELRHIHAFDNIDEFITEAFTSPEFQEWLAHTPIPPGLRTGRSALASRISSLWDWLAAKVGEALGITGVQQSVLGEMMRVGHRLELAALAHPPGPLKGYAREFANSAPSAEQLFSKRGRPEFPGGTRASRADDIVARAGDITVGASLRARAVALALSTVDQMRQHYGHLFTDAKGNALEEVISNTQKIEPWANKLRTESEQVGHEYLDWAKRNKEDEDEFADLGNSATQLNVNLGPRADNGHLGENAWWGVQAKEHLPGLNRRFDALMKRSPEAKAIWDKMAAYYRKTQNAEARALASNFLDLLETPLTPAERTAIIDKVVVGKLDETDRLLINNPIVWSSLKDAREVRVQNGVYFPQMRHGAWAVTYSDKIKDTMGGKEVEPGVVEFRADKDKDARALADEYMKKTPFVVLDARRSPEEATTTDTGWRVKVQLRGLQYFDTPTEAAKWIRTEGRTHDAVDQEPQPRRSTGYESGDLQNSQLASLVNSVRQRFPGDANHAQREMMIQAIHQAAVRMMSGNRVQQRSLSRLNVMGAGTDFARNVAQYGHASSRYLAKLEFMPAVREAQQRMRDIYAAQQHDVGQSARTAVMNELSKRLEQNVIGLKEPSKWIQRVKTLTYMNKLVGPSWNVINSMQPSLVTFPYLAGRYGLMKAGLAISNSYSAVGGRGIVGMGLTNTAATIRQYARTAAETGDIIAFIRKNLSAAPDGAALVRAFNHAVERGALDETNSMMIDAAIAGGTNAFDLHLSKVDRVARQLAIAVEAMNRSTTLVATYRLAVASGKTAEQAVQEAFDTVQNTQGDYSAMNAPAAFNHPVWGLSLQFKKYAQMMYALMGDMLYRAVKGDERAVALKQLATLVGTQVLAAGALGIPGAELIKLSFMAAGALGIGGGYDDWERKVRAFLAHQLGQKASELLTKGIIPHAFGLDLSSRIGMDTLLTFGEPRRYEEDPSWAWMARTVAGAPFGVVADQFIAARAFAEGEGWKGVEHLPMPKFVVDAAKAVDHMTNAKHSARTGKETAPAIGPVTAGVNFLGFKTAGQEEQSASGGAKFAVREQITNEGRALTKMRNEFAEAKTEGERVKVLARLKEWNKGKSADEQKSPADLKKFAKRYQEDKAKGLTDSGFRARNDAEMKRIKDAASPYGV